MSLNIVIGKSNSGKSKYIYNSILNNGKEKNTILFVPKMARIVAEQEYFKYTNKNSIDGFKITTIDREIEKNIDYTLIYQDKKYMSDMAKKMYIKRAIKKYEDDFKIFSKLKQNDEFITLLCTYFDIFERQEITINEIEEKYKEDDFTKAKLKELISIYEKIEEDRRKKFVDTLDQTRYVITKMYEKKEEIKNMDIYFDSYNNFSSAEFEYIMCLLKYGAEVTITLNLDLDSEDDGIFKESFKTYNKLKDICDILGIHVNNTVLEQNISESKEDIAYLSDNIFLNNKKYEGKAENINVILVNNQYDELEYIAKDITEKVVYDNARYKDFVVYTNDIESYYLIIKRVFSKYNIPVFCNTKYDIKNSNIAKYLLLLLYFSINKFEYRKHAKLLELLHTGFVNVPQNLVSKFENYIAEFDIKGYMLEKEFIKNTNKMGDYEYTLEEINSVRETLIQNIQKFKKELENKNTAKEITKTIYDFLIEKEIITKFEREVSNIRDVEMQNKQKQILKNIYEIMDNISVCDDNITLEEYYELFKFGINDKCTYTIPAMADIIEVCDINRTRNVIKDYEYILGVNENSMPRMEASDATFSDVELEKLNSLGVEIRKTTPERINMELFNIYLAINKCRKNITFLVPNSRLTGESLRPSSIIQNVKNTVDIEMVSDVNKKIDTEEKLFKECVNEICNNNIEENTYTKYKFLQNTNKYRRIFEYSRKDNNLNTRVLNKLYNKEIKLSVSRLENLKLCPFSYYNRYVLKLKPKSEYNISKMDMGSIMHEVLEKVSRYIMSQNISWEEILTKVKIKTDIEKKINKIIDNIFEKEFKKYDENIRINILKINLKKSMLRIILNIATSIKQSEFKPLGYEVAFDNDSIFAPIEIILDDETKVYLRGKIDRIDLAKTENTAYLRIVDYKSYDKSIKLSDIKEGISLQLMTYMAALLENKKKVTNEGTLLPVAINYFTINTSILNMTEYEKNEEILKDKIIKALKFKGIYIKDVGLLSKLDSKVKDNNKSYIDVNVTRLNNDEKYLTEQEFLKECENIKGTLKSLATEIKKGNVKIKPHSEKKCEYCEYKEVCRKKSVV